MQNILKEYFGYQQFRDGQKEIIDKVIDHRPTLGVMPTGGGKSICYQVPGLYLDGLTIVISPLISLMKDQVDSLRSMGIKAEFLNSNFPPFDDQFIPRRRIKADGRARIFQAFFFFLRSRNRKVGIKSKVSESLQNTF